MTVLVAVLCRTGFIRQPLDDYPAHVNEYHRIYWVIAAVAQSVEQVSRNEQVEGLTPFSDPEEGRSFSWTKTAPSGGG